MSSTNDSDQMLPEPFPTTPDAIENADWPERGASVIEAFNDGGAVVKFDYAGGKYDPLSGGLYYVPPGVSDVADGERHTVWYEIRGSYKRDERQRRAMLIGRLNERTGFWWEDSTPSSGSIPVSVAVDGQKAIASYLFAMNRLDVDAIAGKMDKSDQTIRQYLSDYKAGRTA